MINKLVRGVEGSTFKRWMINKILAKKIPFNSPHKLTLIAAGTDSVTVQLPFISRNRNHIKSMHACALATLCEFTSGLQLARLLNEKKYRLILKEINMQYSFQAKTDVFATFTYSEQQLHSEITSVLEHLEAVEKRITVDAFDINKNKICTGSILWQLKKWQSVKTKL